jgi:hypothetical protein
MSADTGGPAFPANEERFSNGTLKQLGTPGMTLRDYFAAKAMQGLMDAAMPMPEIADAAYEMADAMLKARGQ